MNALPSPPAPDALDSARRTLTTEIAGLAALAEALDGTFADAIALFAALPGRVVVSGIGKSGHVGRKIAATLASTGTPSLFVHAAEASHGDMGMVLPGDALLALSKSGETSELADIIAHAGRFGIPLVAITARADGTLARAATLALLLPDVEEACPIGIAPTTSTTMQMALGDAIAVALMRRRGFSADQFRDYHPGGQLGARLLRVAAVMHAGDALPLAQPDTPMSSALITMTRKRFGCLGVADPASGRLLGIITDGDLRRAMGPDLLARTAGAIMNPAPRVFDPAMLAAKALHAMNDPARPVTSAFVVDDAGVPVGILHIHDLLRAGLG